MTIQEQIDSRKAFIAKLESQAVVKPTYFPLDKGYYTYLQRQVKKLEELKANGAIIAVNL